MKWKPRMATSVLLKAPKALTLKLPFKHTTQMLLVVTDIDGSVAANLRRWQL